MIEGVHIWLAALDDSDWPSAADLPRAERERASAFLREQAARRWVASRWALRSVLGRYLGLEAAEVELELGEQGKPRLRGRDALAFNLSHSGAIALVAVAERPIGIDVELITARHPPAFYDDWVRKEARVKCLGVGLGTPPPPAPVTIAALDICPGYAAAVAIEGTEIGPLDYRSLPAG